MLRVVGADEPGCDALVGAVAGDDEPVSRRSERASLVRRAADVELFLPGELAGKRVRSYGGSREGHRERETGAQGEPERWRGEHRVFLLVASGGAARLPERRSSHCPVNWGKGDYRPGSRIRRDAG